MSVLIQKTAGYVSLSYCVATVLADLEDYSGRLTEKLTQLAIRAITNLNVYRSHYIECDYFEMDANGIVDISSLTDFVDIVKIAMPVNGQPWILSKSKNILPRRDELDAAELALIFKGASTNLDISTGYYFGDPANGLFGLGGGYNRSCYYLDTELMQIQFDTTIPRSQILLEYRSTGIKATGATTIPRYLVEYVVAYLHWQLKMHDVRVDRFTRRDLKEEYLEQERILTNYCNEFDMDDYFNMTYGSLKQTPKR